jgi:hypothetical protein
MDDKGKVVAMLVAGFEVSSPHIVSTIGKSCSHA